jgi:hypothetical protein
MRIVALVFGCIFLVASAGTGALTGLRCLIDAKRLELVEHDAAQLGGEAESLVGSKLEGLTSGRAKAGAAIAFVLAILSIALLVLMFVNKQVPVSAVLVAVTGIAAIVAAPSYEAGFGPAAPRSLAIITFVFALMGGVMALLAWLGKRKLSARAAV